MNQITPISNQPIQVGVQTALNPLTTTKRASSAKRLVSTKDMAYQDWLEVRKQGIGSSDAATACGLNPYMSMLELWLIKTGRQTQSIEDESTGVAPLYWGKQLEPLVAEYYSMHTNNKVRRVNAVLQHQLAVTGKQAAHVCVLLCGHESKIFKVTRSESVIEHIINAERYFWECVEKDTPPSVDASESAAKAIQQLYPIHVPLTVEDLSQNETANLMFDQLIKLKEEIQHKQERFDALKHQIQMMMKDAERATFSRGSVVWKKANDSVSLDTKALLKHQPDLIEQ